MWRTRITEPSEVQSPGELRYSARLAEFGPNVPNSKTTPDRLDNVRLLHAEPLAVGASSRRGPAAGGICGIRRGSALRGLRFDKLPYFCKPVWPVCNRSYETIRCRPSIARRDRVTVSRPKHPARDEIARGTSLHLTA